MNERRSRWLLILLLISQLLLLGAQVPDAAGQRSLLHAAVLRMVAPLAHGVEGGAGLLSSLGDGFELRRQLRRDNQRLAAEVAELRRERIRYQSLESELERLRQAVAYAPPAEGSFQVADIVYIDHASWLQTLLVYVGGQQVEVDQAVLSTEGLVGRVVTTASPYAKVQLVTDRAASVGAMIERTRRQGVIRGSEGGLLQMDFVPLQADVRVGDVVLSAGIDGVYPRGIRVGTVSEVAPGDELFHRISLHPSVDFGKLDQVFLLGRQQVPEELTREGGDEGP